MANVVVFAFMAICGVFYLVDGQALNIVLEMDGEKVHVKSNNVTIHFSKAKCSMEQPAAQQPSKPFYNRRHRPIDSAGFGVDVGIHLPFPKPTNNGPPRSGGGRVVCYYGSWAVHRPGMGKFDVEDIDPELCTHVIYAFAGLNPSSFEIESVDPKNDLDDNNGRGAYIRFTNLTKRNPNLKCILGVGGANVSSTKFSTMANKPDIRARFVKSVLPFLKKYGFHGLDVVWEYPTQNGRRPSDKAAFVDLLKELKAALEPEGLLLTAAVSAQKYTIDDAYDVPEIIKYLDFINVETFDFHGPWESLTGHNAPLAPRPDEPVFRQPLSVATSVDYWLKLGAPAHKLVIGMATYGHTFQLANRNYNGIHAPSLGPGEEGPFTRQPGILGYNEVCVNLQNGGWTVVTDLFNKAPFAYKYDQWVGYDDIDSIAEKCKLVNRKELGGGMVWSIDTDDFRKSCSRHQFPLLTVMNSYIRGTNAHPTTTLSPNILHLLDLQLGHRSQHPVLKTE